MEVNSLLDRGLTSREREYRGNNTEKSPLPCSHRKGNYYHKSEKGKERVGKFNAQGTREKDNEGENRGGGVSILKRGT